MSPSTITFTKGAVKDLARIQAKDRERIRAALARYATEGEGDVRPLVGRQSEYRLRVGDYRIIFEREEDRLVILVLAVGHRRDVYRD